MARNGDFIGGVVCVFHVEEESEKSRTLFQLTSWNGHHPKLEVRPQYFAKGEWKNNKLRGINKDQLKILENILPDVQQFLEDFEDQDWQGWAEDGAEVFELTEA